MKFGHKHDASNSSKHAQDDETSMHSPMQHAMRNDGKTHVLDDDEPRNMVLYVETSGVR